MKRVKFFLLIAVIGWGLSSCQDSTETQSPDLSLEQGADDLIGTDAFNSMTDQLISPELSEGTEEANFEVVSDGFPEDPSVWSAPEEEGSRGMRRHCDLNLSDEQRAQMMEARKAFVECVKPNLTNVRAAVKEILQTANQERKSLVEQYKNGEISKEELRAALDDLKASVKELIQSNSVVQAGVEAIKACHEGFVEAAQEILTEEQFAQWQECKKKARHKMEKKGKKRGKRGG